MEAFSDGFLVFLPSRRPFLRWIVHHHTRAMLMGTPSAFPGLVGVNCQPPHVPPLPLVVLGLRDQLSSGQRGGRTIPHSQEDMDIECSEGWMHEATLPVIVLCESLSVTMERSCTPLPLDLGVSLSSRNNSITTHSIPTTQAMWGDGH